MDSEHDTPDAGGSSDPPIDEKGISRKKFVLGGAAAGAAIGLGAAGTALGGGKAPATPRAHSNNPNREFEGLVLTKGKIHTMDGSRRVVEEVLIKDGRFLEVGNRVDRHPSYKVLNLKGRTVIPGIIDAHNHIVLVGNRPGWHISLEHVFTIPDVIAEMQAWSAQVPPGEFITTIGPISAMQLAEQRLPTLTELDAVNRPVYIQAAQGGSRTNSAAKAWLEARGVVVAADGSIGGGATGTTGALAQLRHELLTPETRKRTAKGALQYFTRLGITTHRDSGAFHAESPLAPGGGGLANENLYTMHNPFLALNREGSQPARLRIDFVHQDGTTDPTIPTLTQRLKNTFPFFGNDWLRTGGVGEHTGAGITGLRAIAAARWRGEDHALNLAGATTHVANREIVHAEYDISDLRWVLSHVPAFPEDLANRFHAIGGGVLVGWGPTRTGTNVGPPYKALYDHPIPVGWHSDGGDITVISPWLNLYTMVTGKNLRGDHILGDQVLSRQEAMWLATAANKWFIWEDDLGSIEVGNHADLAVLDRDWFTVPDDQLTRTQSELTIVGGKVVHDTGAVK